MTNFIGLILNSVSTDLFPMHRGHVSVGNFTFFNEFPKWCKKVVGSAGLLNSGILMFLIFGIGGTFPRTRGRVPEWKFSFQN